MKIDKRYRPELCAEKHDSYRPALAYVNLATFNGMDVAIGADGYICSVVPVEMGPDDARGLVHWSIFQYARRLPIAKSSGMIVMDIGAYEVVFTNGWSAPRAMHPKWDELKFPDLTPIVARKKGEMQSVFGVNPDLLSRTASAIGYSGAEGLYVHRDSETSPLVVALSYQDGVPVPPFSLVMPLHLSEVPRAARSAKAAAA